MKKREENSRFSCIIISKNIEIIDFCRLFMNFNYFFPISVRAKSNL